MSKRKLEKIAMLGTKRNEVSAPNLLQTFGIQELQNRAGYLPQQTLRNCVVQNIGNNANYCSDKALNFLRDILEGSYPDALREWIVVAGESSQIIPSEYLPALLELGTKDKPLRPYIVRIGGGGLLWLAQQNNESSWYWVNKYAHSLPDYLADAYLLERESDAWTIGSILLGMKRNSYQDLDNYPDDVGRRGVLLEEPIFTVLSSDAFAWSIPLTEVYMLAIYKEYMTNIPSILPYHLSLQIEMKQLKYWRNLVRKQFLNRYQSLSETLEQLMNIIEFRQEMRKTILGSA